MLGEHTTLTRRRGHFHEGKPSQFDVEVPSLPFQIGRAYADANVPIFVRNDLSFKGR